MKKWCVVWWMVGLVAGASALETTITCEQIADQVDVAVTWSSSTVKGYRLYGRPNIVYGDWDDLTDRIATPGLFETNLPSAQYFFKVEEYELSAPSDGMVLILAGTNSGTDPDFGNYSLTVGRFWMDTKEVSGAEWDEVVGWATNSSSYAFPNLAASAKAPNHPISSIRWIEAALYCNAKSEKEGRTPCYTKDGEVLRSYSFTSFEVDCNFQANGYRLPTNDEWEYAARGGLSGKRFPTGDTISHDKANYTANNTLPYDDSNGPNPAYWINKVTLTPYTAPVSDLPQNGYGLYHMAGNVGEFTTLLIPVEMVMYTETMVRGGSWDTAGDKLRCGDKPLTGGWMSNGYLGNGDTGFRTVVSAP